jgi:hypothetical protein
MQNPTARLFLCIAAAWSVTGIVATETRAEDRSASASLRRDRHVVIVVWDGMRPDLVSEQYTPTLWRLAQGGVTFRNHHSVYPSATVVNGTAIKPALIRTAAVFLRITITNRRSTNRNRLTLKTSVSCKKATTSAVASI